ncbi:hypothetical protein BX600DRAFT_519386 [Xylariales sp. PMI_506]|nr:hypothetical protein BX600DRAFT_519386 [Xylariales sp. PMI_506]
MATTSGKGVVLVTGANSYIAGPTINSFLDAGYSVRGTVRSRKTAGGLLAALREYVNQGRFELLEIPDIAAPGAFDEAIKGSSAVAHLASPLSLVDTDIEGIMRSAVEGTLSVARSALAEPSVKSFVYMSSVVTLRSFTTPGTYTESDWNTEVEDLVREKGGEAGGIPIYAASKLAAERALWKFAEEKKPAFSVTTLCPVWVAGPPLFLPEDPSQNSLSNIFIWEVFSGQTPPGPAGYGAHVDVRDVARMTVFAVERPDVAGGERYIVATEGSYAPPQAAADILREAYPGRRGVIKEGTPGEGYLPGWAYPTEGAPIAPGEKALKATGQAWIPYDKMVLDAAKMFEAYL